MLYMISLTVNTWYHQWLLSSPPALAYWPYCYKLQRHAAVRGLCLDLSSPHADVLWALLFQCFLFSFYPILFSFCCTCNYWKYFTVTYLFSMSFPLQCKLHGREGILSRALYHRPGTKLHEYLANEYIIWSNVVHAQKILNPEFFGIWCILNKCFWIRQRSLNPALKIH